MAAARHRAAPQRATGRVRAGTPGPGAGSTRARLSRLLVAATALLAGVLFATSASTADGTDLRAGRRLQLTELIAQERAALAQDEQAATALRDQVDAATRAAAARDGGVAAERARGDALALAAGTVPVRGPGLAVALDDAPRGTAADSPDDLVVHQQDVQAVVNALWSGGAEAMTLMGERVVSTSAVRCVGNTVVLHGRVYGPPFRVVAVGDVPRMRAALDDEPGVLLFRRYVERFGLGYDVVAQDDALLPAYDGALDLPALAPAGGAPAAAPARPAPA